MTGQGSVVVFDVYRTLIEVETDETVIEPYDFLSRWLGYHGVLARAEDLQERYRGASRHSMRATGGEFPDIDVRKIFVEIFDGLKHASDVNTEDLVDEALVLLRMLTTRRISSYPETIPILEALHGRVRMAIASNAQRAFTIPELRSLGLLQFFEQIVFSSDVRAGKPDPRIFQEVLARLRATTDDAVHVRDDPFDDVLGAKRAGLRVILIDRGTGSTRGPTFIGPEPDVRLQPGQISDLPQVILDLLKPQPS